MTETPTGAQLVAHLVVLATSFLATPTGLVTLPTQATLLEMFLAPCPAAPAPALPTVVLTVSPLMDLVVSLVVFRETFLVALLSISLVLVRLSFLAAFLPMHLRTSLAHPVLPTLVSLTSPPVLSAPQRLLLSLSTQQTLRTDKISPGLTIRILMAQNSYQLSLPSLQISLL